jgi:hypothetical protein
MTAAEIERRYRAACEKSVATKLPRDTARAEHEARPNPGVVQHDGSPGITVNGVKLT